MPLAGGRRKAWSKVPPQVVAVAFVSLLAATAFGPPLAQAEAPPDGCPEPCAPALHQVTHTWACGRHVPPSGPYLNVTNHRLYHYDCAAGAVVELGQGDSNVDGCLWMHALTQPVPIAGVCPLLEETSDDWHQKRFLLAAIGSEVQLAWEIREWASSGEMTTRHFSGVAEAVGRDGVVFWQAADHEHLECVSVGGPNALVARMEWPRDSGDWYGPHNGSCTDPE